MAMISYYCELFIGRRQVSWGRWANCDGWSSQQLCLHL